VSVDDDLPWMVVKYWYPDLKLQIPPAQSISVESEDATDNPATPRHRPRKPKPPR
jgi:hypothetical protein